MKCNNCKAEMKELKYCYDDDWGFKGSKVWVLEDEESKLMYCPNCGNVQVKVRTENK